VVIDCFSKSDDLKLLIQQHLDSAASTSGVNTSTNIHSNANTNKNKDTASANTAATNASTAAAQQGSGAGLTAEKVEPRMLFMTSKDPDVEADVLPFFCFPR
jgi:hypothetical protein